MYIAFIYDHEYVKSDQDFYGDAIISFYPAEYKEKYIYLLGQIIGTIEFMKGFFNAKLNQFKLDNLIILFKSYSPQFSLIIATDNVTVTKDLLLGNILKTLFKLIRFVNGPICKHDRADELEYSEFKQRLVELSTDCFNLVFKAKIQTFNSYFTLSPFILQLLEKCVQFDEALILPSKCFLVRATLGINLYNSLMNSSIETKFSEETDESSFAENHNLDGFENSTSDIDLTMDTLPETFRFTRYFSFHDLMAKNLETAFDDSESDDFIAGDQSIACNTQDLIIYVQTNSKLKIILFISEDMKENLKNDSLIKDWQRIVSYFSNLEYELSNVDDVINAPHTKNASSNMINLATMTAADLINVKRNDIYSYDQYYYSCVIDRSRQLKFNANEVVGPNSQVQPLALTPDIAANMNVFYEIIQSMPELSKLQISKKGHCYNYLKQNVVTIASSTLEESISEINNDKKNKPLQTFAASTSTTSKNNLKNNNTRRRRNRSLTSSFGKGFGADTKSSDLASNNKQRPSSAGLRLDTNEGLILSNNTTNSTNKTQNRLLKDLQYGDILFRCTSFN